MCYQVKKQGKVYTYTHRIDVVSSMGTTYPMRWGIPSSSISKLIQHARIENLYTTWRILQNKRMFLEVDSLWEGRKEFTSKELLVNNPIRLGVIHNGSSFVILTQPSFGIIKKVHDRMPVIINDREDYFFNSRDLDPYVFVQRLKIA
jgi:putative SOS response-associated peptidase YedK